MSESEALSTSSMESTERATASAERLREPNDTAIMPFEPSATNGFSNSPSTNSSSHSSSDSQSLETSERHVATTSFRTTNQLRPTDVLIGRGALINSYSGNVNYRRLIRAQKPAYKRASSHSVKDSITRRIIQEIHDSTGRFLQKMERANEAPEQRTTLDVCQWYILPPFDIVVLEKVKQALRERKQATEMISSAARGRAIMGAVPSPNNMANLIASRPSASAVTTYHVAPPPPPQLPNLSLPLQPHVPQLLSGGHVHEGEYVDLSRLLTEQSSSLTIGEEFHPPGLGRTPLVPPLLGSLNTLRRLLVSTSPTAAAAVAASSATASLIASGHLENLTAVLAAAASAGIQANLVAPPIQSPTNAAAVTSVLASIIGADHPSYQNSLDIPSASTGLFVPPFQPAFDINGGVLPPSMTPLLSTPSLLSAPMVSTSPLDIPANLLALRNLAQSLEQSTQSTLAQLQANSNLVSASTPVANSAMRDLLHSAFGQNQQFTAHNSNLSAAAWSDAAAGHQSPLIAAAAAHAATTQTQPLADNHHDSENQDNED